MKMLRYLSTIVFLASSVNCELVFSWSQYRGIFNITCAGANTSTDGIQHPISMEISRSDNGNNFAASQTMFETHNSFNGSDLTGSFLNNLQIDNPYLTLSWHIFNSSLEGTYLCILYGLGVGSAPHSVVKELIFRKEDLDPVLSTTPSHIVDGLTRSLVVECYSTRIGQEDWFEPSQIEIFQAYSMNIIHIATVLLTGDIITVNLTGNVWTILSSYVVMDQAVFVELSREYPSIREAGTYTCDFSAIQNDYVTVIHKVKSANVTASVVTIYDTYDSYIGSDDLKDYFLYACNFEDGLCGFNLSLTTTPGKNWRFMRGLLPDTPVDHTLPNGSGHYLAVALNTTEGYTGAAMSLTLPLEIGKVYCIGFWSIVYDRSASITVNRRLPDSLTTLFARVTASNDANRWEKSLFSYEATAPAQFIFEFVFDASFTQGYGFAAIDDIAVSDMNCKSPL